jgi:hypothetical protein
MDLSQPRTDSNPDRQTPVATDASTTVVETTLLAAKSKESRWMLPPKERMILALFLFVDVILICAVLLLVTEKVSLPF